MNIVRTAAALEKVVTSYRKKHASIGFVPTMGDFHEGHVSLMRAARRENKRVLVSIFVNPLQFGPGEDFRRYPRRLAADVILARRAGVDVIFAPPVAVIYPPGFQSRICAGKLTQKLCGRDRPGHFDGVTTVVGRLFHLVRPDRAYFGLKDYQQALVVRQMVRDLAFPVQLRFCPLVRDKDGVALSSRNRYLSPADRLRAQALYEALLIGKNLIKNGERRAETMRSAMRRRLLKSVDDLRYVAVAHPDTLEEVAHISGPVLLAIAARVGKARLIDNLLIKR